MNVAPDVAFVVVTPVVGLSRVGAKIGNRLDGYVTEFVPVGTLVTNVRKYPYENKRFYADMNGKTYVFMKDTLKRAPKPKKSKDDSDA